jgi:4'-phosphopantetheinyl transferase
MPAPIHVYLLRLPGGAPEAPCWLEGDDRLRYRGMRSPRRRAEFAGGRLLVRHAMAASFPGLRWRLSAPEGELPRVLHEGEPKLAPVVSIAHSAGVVACAVSAARRLGIDIEYRNARKRDVDGLAQATLHPLEQAALATLPANGRLDAFLRYWTLKEALAKALGEGLSLPFRDFAFDDTRLAAAPAHWSGAGERWSFAHPPAAGDAVLGLAWSGEGGADAVSLHHVTSQQLPGLVAR